MTGTSIRTPTTVARAALEARPKRVAAVAMATSNLSPSLKSGHSGQARVAQDL